GADEVDVELPAASATFATGQPVTLAARRYGVFPGPARA
ncbi:sulfate ABC transporter ATP-binding protein, partial [Xanthomonas sp. Kuri4-2]